jgi:hypothetical protein
VQDKQGNLSSMVKSRSMERRYGESASIVDVQVLMS